jgi:hypothetical protein
MKIFEIVEQQERKYFAGIITEDESWFVLEYLKVHVWRLENQDIPERISKTN